MYDDIAELLTIATRSMLVKMFAAHYYEWAIKKFISDPDLQALLLFGEAMY